MELEGIADGLVDKCIFITGSTGFLAKMEKVLRVQPKVKKLYLLVRAADAESAAQRLQTEVIEKDLFNLLREKQGKDFNAFISDKIIPVPGEIIHDSLGIEDQGMKELIWKDVTMFIHVAATTNFYDRYDVALNINVLGAKHVMEFAKRCSKLEMFLHVSTAYVIGEKQGILLEKALKMGETLKDNLYLDIDEEMKLVERRKKEILLDNSMHDVEKMAMRELGIERARYFGWPNTYVFTKAMAEMVLGKVRGDFPLVIARPTIITSIRKDPLPGWIEGNRTIDNIIVGYAQGNLPCIVADVENPMDVIPGDMVVNAMLAMVVAHSNQQGEFIYHISSSVSNPVKGSILPHCGFRYFAENPRIGKDGKPICLRKIPIFNSLAKFYVFFFIRYRLPLEILRLVNVILCYLFSKKYNELSRKYKFVMRLIDLYIPYCFFKGCFDDINLERLRMAAKKSPENHIFDFDPKNIDWDDYFYNIHIPGVLKYVCK